MAAASSAVSQTLPALRHFFDGHEAIELAVLIGSRARGCERVGSDWDFAVQWSRGLSFMDILGRTERLRAELAGLLATTAEHIDIVDIPTARLAMRSAIAEEGLLLKGDGSLAWSRFLLRTWRELEDFHWERQHAA